MMRTRFCELLGIEHPVALGGMASIPAPPLVAAVSEAGGLGNLGATSIKAADLPGHVAAIRERTDKPFGLNYLLFEMEEDRFEAALAAKPAVLSFAWPRRDQDLKACFGRARAAGAKVMLMVGRVDEARRGAEAGADIIVAQGTEGGGHVGWMASVALVPMVVDAVAPLPVLAAGGFADGRGLAAALALGAEGVLMGTRFLATEESSLHPNFKRAILESDGHDTDLTEIPDIAAGRVWPGAMARALRNRFIRRWAGREWELRLAQPEAAAALARARERGDAEEASLLIGQDAGLVRDIPPAGALVRRIVEEAEAALKGRLPRLAARASPAGRGS